MSRGKSYTAGTSATGSIRLGARLKAAGAAVGGVPSVRFSWQPMHPTVSPGCSVTKLCIRLTARSCSSSATKKTLRIAGTSKWAEPSASTGTVPRTRSSVNVPP